jgi:hypothetical protein
MLSAPSFFPGLEKIDKIEKTTYKKTRKKDET